jgi:glutaminase
MLLGAEIHGKVKESHFRPRSHNAAIVRAVKSRGIIHVTAEEGIPKQFLHCLLPLSDYFHSIVRIKQLSVLLIHQKGYSRVRSEIAVLNS